MSANVRPPAPLTWTAKLEAAAALVAADQLADVEIARQVGITDRQLRRWKRHPDFAARVASLVADLREAVRGRGIAERQNRVDRLNADWDGLQRVKAARAQQYADVPGGETGLLIRQVKLVKVYDVGADAEAGEGDEYSARHSADDGETLFSAKRSVEVVEYAIDTGLLKELRAHEEQAAKELGQWTEKLEHSGEILVRRYIGVSPDDV